MTRAYLSGKIVMTLFVAVVYYSYLLAPDWMWMYFVKATDVPFWVVVYVLILYYFAYDVGFFLKCELGKIHKSFPILMMVIAIAWAVGVTVALNDRYQMVGTIEQFYAGQGVPLAQSAVGRVPALFAGLLVPIAIGLLIWSRRQKFS